MLVAVVRECVSELIRYWTRFYIPSFHYFKGNSLRNVLSQLKLELPYDPAIAL